MKRLPKKWIIRLAIAELIVSILAATVLTPLLFGSIKPFKKINLAKTAGIVQKLDSSSYMEGSHSLKINGKTAALLKSKKINLDKYVGKLVAIQGVVKKSAEGLVKIIGGPTVDKRVNIITVTSIKVKN